MEVKVREPAKSAPLVVSPIRNLSSDSSYPIKALLSAPRLITIPASLSGVPVVPTLRPNNVSETLVLVVLTVVKSPCTTRSPVNFKLANCTLSVVATGCPISITPVPAV